MANHPASAPSAPHDSARDQRTGLRSSRNGRARYAGSEKYQVLMGIAQALNARSLPPLDEGGKSILVSQIGTLLKGGYSLELVKRVAIATALSWDERRGHGRLLHLAQRIRLIDADEQRARHEQQKADEGQVHPRVARLLSPARHSRPHPNLHAFVRSDRENSCALCEGPIGVHVRLVGIDNDGNGIVVSTGLTS
jgi:hypothetical protein